MKIGEVEPMIELGTKADTLESLRGHVTNAVICPSIILTADNWNKDQLYWITKIKNKFGGQSVIVRSSAINEDSVASTMAGFHDSVLDVSADSPDDLSEAISRVILSYQRSGQEWFAENQILIQPMVKDVSMSGVVFTQDLNTGGPYYVINYDDSSGKTDAITSGVGDSGRTLLIHRGALGNLQSIRFASLMEAVTELESIIRSPGLDIEFAVTKNDEVYLLQVRRLTVQRNWNRAISRRIEASLRQIKLFLKSRFKPNYGVLGRRSILGVMPDWNPIEMLGAIPRPLAVSLYRYLITDSTWARARAEMGYRDLTGRPLMVNLGGRVYIDVRESFNSFLPAALNDDISGKLVDYWLDTLENHPEFHDKIEFEVATTVYSFDFVERNKPTLTSSGLNDKEFYEYSVLLRELTNKIIGGVPDIITSRLQLVDEMDRRRERLFRHRENNDNQNELVLVKALLDDCRELGTKSFSIIARCAFIAEEFLRSFVRAGVIESATALLFRRSVKTILSDFLASVRDYQQGKITYDNFITEYGHLRPGTYDIRSKRYDQHEELKEYNPALESPGLSEPVNEFKFPENTFQRLDGYLIDKGYDFDSKRLFSFMRDAIAGREYSKFKFTRNISDSLELIARWGMKIGLSREELSFIPINDLLDNIQKVPCNLLEDYLRVIAERERETYRVSRAIRLPFLITSASDVDVIPLLKCRPNFITHGNTRGPVLLLSGQEVKLNTLKDHIVLIETADPGYDWIFLGKIAGLITKYGGANSHMAIRCAESNIPAAIGCGEQLFELLADASEVALDCAAEHVVPVK